MTIRCDRGYDSNTTWDSWCIIELFMNKGGHEQWSKLYNTEYGVQSVNQLLIYMDTLSHQLSTLLA